MSVSGRIGANPFALYTGTVLVAGGATAGWWLADPPRLDAPAAFVMVAALAILVAAWPGRPQPGDTTAMAPATFTFALLLGWGAAPAIAVQAVAVLVASARRRYPPWRALYVTA